MNQILLQTKTTFDLYTSQSKMQIQSQTKLNLNVN